MVKYPGKRYFSLTKERKKLFCQAFFLFIFLRLLMGRVALKKIIRFLSSRKKGEGPAHITCGVDDILWSVQAAARRVRSTTCLMNALVAEYLLKKNGINSRLFIGVQKNTESELAAHVWMR